MTKPFQCLDTVSNESILVAMTNEHPQTMAVIISHLQPEQAAYIIESLPPERQLAVIRRMAMMQQVERVVIEIVERELYRQVSNQDYVNVGGIDAVVETLLQVEQETVSNILENLSQDDPEFVEIIKDQMRIAKGLRAFNREQRRVR